MESFFGSKSPPTYAESLLNRQDFRFQLRNNEKVDFHQILNIDIDQIVRDADVRALQQYVRRFLFTEIIEEDFTLYGNACFLKLINLAQLSLEYLFNAQDTLSSDLNCLVKKYRGKMMEVQRLTSKLARKEAQITTRYDESHYNKDLMKNYDSVPAMNVNHNDPSLYPSQEQREKSFNQCHDNSKSMENKKTFQLHIVSTTDEIYYSIDVPHSITIQDLREEITDMIASHNGNSRSTSWSQKSKKVVNIEPLSTTMNDCVEMNKKKLTPLTMKNDNNSSYKDWNIDVFSSEKEKGLEKHGGEGFPIAENEDIFLPLTELMLTATKTNEELAETTRTMRQYELWQYKNKTALFHMLRFQLQSFENAWREEVNNLSHTFIPLLLSNLRMSEIETSKKAEKEGEDNEYKKLENESYSKNKNDNDLKRYSREKSSIIDLLTVDGSNASSGRPMKVDANDVVDVPQFDVAYMHEPENVLPNALANVSDAEIRSKNQEQNPCEIPSTIDNSLVDRANTPFDRLADSPRFFTVQSNEVNNFSPLFPSAVQMYDDEIEYKQGSVFKLPETYGIQRTSKTSMIKSSNDKRTPIPTYGYLDRGEQPVRSNEVIFDSVEDAECLSVSQNIPNSTPPSFNKIFGGLEKFPIINYRLDDCVAVEHINRSFDEKIGLSNISDDTPEIIVKICPAQSDKGMTTDSDIQTIDITLVDTRSIPEEDSKASAGIKGKVSWNRFGGGKAFIKIGLSNWRKSSRKKSSINAKHN